MYNKHLIVPISLIILGIFLFGLGVLIIFKEYDKESYVNPTMYVDRPHAITIQELLERSK